MYPGAHVAAQPDKPAVIMASTGQQLTYRELHERASQLANLFRSLGLVPGDHVAFLLENHVRSLELAWGATYAGLYYTAISTRLTPSEAEYIVNDCGAKVFISSHAQRDLAWEILGGIPNAPTRLMLDGTVDGFDPYEEAVARHSVELVEGAVEGADMLYSSGTTGRPKGVKPVLVDVPLGTPNGLVLLCQGLFGFDTSTVYLSPAPLYHAAPLRFCMSAQRLGGTAVIMDHFDAEEALALIERYQITHSQWVPTMFIRMLRLPAETRARYDVSSLKVAIHAAAPCPAPVKRQMIDWWGPVIHEYYAGTEGNGFVWCNSEDWLAHPGTVGKPLFGKIHILDENGVELPPGEPGTVYFADGPAFEYHNDPDKTRTAYNPKGWSTLGDVGYLDADGFLHLTDRKAYMIITGGVNVYPQEAENVLSMHPKVLDVAVFGVPNEEFGEEVKAVVQPVDMALAGPELERELIAYCREHLSHIKCPRTVDFEPELPRHPTGKLYKRLLRDKYWEGHETKLV